MKIFSLEMVKNDICLGGTSRQSTLFQKCVLTKRAHAPNQGFIQALLLTSVFYEGLSLMVIGHNPTYVSTLALAAGGSNGAM